MSEKQPTRPKYSENEVKLMRAKDKARIAELEEAIKSAKGFLLDYSIINDKDGSVARALNVLDGRE